LGNGVRQHIDADPKLANSGRRLVDLTFDAAGLEHEGKRKSADPSADDEDAHDYSPLSRAQAGRPSSIVGRAVRQKYSARPSRREGGWRRGAAANGGRDAVSWATCHDLC